MEIAVIPPTKITQLKHNLLDWAMMARQQNW